MIQHSSPVLYSMINQFKQTASSSTRLITAFAACLCCAVVSNPVFAASAESCIGFGDALYMNAQLDPMIGEAQSELEKANARLKQVKSDWRPQMSTYGRTASGQTGLVDGRTDNQVGVILSQRVFDFGRGRLQQNAAEARVQASNLSIDDVASNSSLDAALTYLSILEARESLAAAQMREDHLNSIMTGVERRLQANLITAAEARSIEADQANAVANRLEIDLRLAAAQSKLAILTSNSGQVCDKIDDINYYVSERLPISLADALFVTSNSATLKAAMQNRKAASAEMEASRLYQLPVFEVQGVAANIYDKDLNEWKGSNRVSLELSAPLFGGRNSGQLDEARANLRTAGLTIDRLAREVKESTSLTWQRIKSYKDLALSRKKARDSLKLEAEALRKEFDNGLRTYQEIETVEADLQLSVLREIEARYLAHQQRIKLLALTNRLQ